MQPKYEVPCETVGGNWVEMTLLWKIPSYYYIHWDTYFPIVLVSKSKCQN